MDDKIKNALNDLPAVEPRHEFRSSLRQDTRTIYFGSTALQQNSKKHTSLPWAMSAAAAILAIIFIIPPQKTYAHIETEGLSSLSRQGNNWVKMANKSNINEQNNTLYIPTGSRSKIVLPTMGSFTAANDCRVDFNSKNKTVRLDGGILETDSDEMLTIILSSDKKIKVNGHVQVNLCLPGGKCLLKSGKATYITADKITRLKSGQMISLDLKHNKTVPQQTAKVIFEKLKNGENVKNILSLKTVKGNSVAKYGSRLVLARRLQDKQALNQLIFALPQLKNLDMEDQYEVMRLINCHSLQDVVSAQKKAFFGVTVKEVEPQLRKLFESHLGIKNGVIINTIVDDSPAKAAKLKRKDIILSVGDTQIINRDDLFNAITSYKPKDRVKIIFLRNGTIKHGEVVLADAPDHLKARRPDLKQLQEELSKQIAEGTSDNVNYMQRLKALLDKIVLKSE